MLAGGPNSERILVLAPLGRDAEVAAGLLRDGWLTGEMCADAAHLARELEQGAGMAIIAEEALATADLTALERWMRTQPPWSDLPIVLLTRRGDTPARNPAAQRLQDILGNVNFLERPFHATTLLSMLRSGLRARRRQYQARALLEDLRVGEERLRLFIEHAPAAIAMLDRDLRYVAVSRRWMQDFKLSGVVVGRGHYEVFPEIPSAWRQSHERCLAGAVEVSNGDRLDRPDGSVVWLKREVRPWHDNRGDIGGLVISWEDITERREAEEIRKLMTGELQHRTKNLIAVIQSIATSSFPVDDPRAIGFCARLHALANAHNLLSESNWGGALIGDVARRELVSFGDRVSIDGPQVLLKPNAVQGFMLVVHELATNAAKHGALSTPTGTISVCWSVENNGAEALLHFRWQERGGPPVTEPRRNGFGSVLLKHALATDSPPLLEYRPEGLRYEVKTQLTTVSKVEAVTWHYPIPSS